MGTDETWKWRYEVGNRYFYGFWAHALEHVGMPHRAGEFQTVRIETADRTIRPDVPTTVTVALDPRSETVEGEAAASLRLVAERTEGASPPVVCELRRAPDSPFVYEGRLHLRDEGAYRLFVEGYEGRGDARVEVSTVGGPSLERADTRVYPDLLRQIADLSGGEQVPLDEFAELDTRLDLSPLCYRWSEQVPLWDGWVALSLLAVLLTIEWVVRKWYYLP
jgi:hypothetical protein